MYIRDKQLKSIVFSQWSRIGYVTDSIVYPVLFDDGDGGDGGDSDGGVSSGLLLSNEMCSTSVVWVMVVVGIWLKDRMWHVRCWQSQSQVSIGVWPVCSAAAMANITCQCIISLKTKFLIHAKISTVLKHTERHSFNIECLSQRLANYNWCKDTSHNDVNTACNYYWYLIVRRVQ